MAQRVQILLVDDLDGSTATETLSFGLDGATYEIDLSDGHAEELRAALQLWLSHARRSGGRKSIGKGRSSSSEGSDERAEIRAWARSNGYEVGEKGRIAASVREAYAARRK